MAIQEIGLHVYRDFENRRVGEPDNGPLAWSAHKERLKVLKEVLDDSAFYAPNLGGAEDENRPHELTEFIVQIVQEPTVQSAFLGAAVYAGSVIAKQVDKLTGRGVEKIMGHLLSAFKNKKVGDFWITLPDGSKINVSPDAEVQISIKNGRTIKYSIDSPPDTNNTNA